MELADMPLGFGEDAETGPGARSFACLEASFLCAQDMRPPSKTPGGRGQDSPHAGTRAEASRTSAVVFAFHASTQPLSPLLPKRTTRSARCQASTCPSRQDSCGVPAWNARASPTPARSGMTCSPCVDARASAGVRASDGVVDADYA